MLLVGRFVFALTVFTSVPRLKVLTNFVYERQRDFYWLIQNNVTVWKKILFLSEIDNEIGPRSGLLSFESFSEQQGYLIKCYHHPLSVSFEN